MQRNGVCQCVCMCIHFPVHTFRNHNGKYILKWKHQRTYLWPCSDTTHSVSQRWCWFTPSGVREQSPSAPRAAGAVKNQPEAFLLCCFAFSDLCHGWFLPLLPAGHGCGSCRGFAKVGRVSSSVLTENTSDATQTSMDPFPQCPSSHETWQKSTTEAAGFAANLLPFSWFCVSSALTSPVSFCCVHPPFSAEPLPSGRRGDLI